jgi:hypothetical protein
MLIPDLGDHPHGPLTQLLRVLLRTPGLHPLSRDEASRHAGAIQGLADRRVCGEIDLERIQNAGTDRSGGSRRAGGKRLVVVDPSRWTDPPVRRPDRRRAHRRETAAETHVKYSAPPRTYAAPRSFTAELRTPPGGKSKSGLRATATDPPAIARLDRQGPAVPQGAASARGESAPRRPRHRLITKDSRLLPAARPADSLLSPRVVSMT